MHTMEVVKATDTDSLDLFLVEVMEAATAVPSAVEVGEVTRLRRLVQEVLIKLPLSTRRIL